MLERRLTTILPTMTRAEAIETRRIHRVVGLTGATWAGLPHDPVVAAGLSGGRFVKNVTRLARQQACDPSPVQRHVEDSFYEQRRESALLPDEVSLAHHGILLLDELPACRRHVLVVLRQPLGKRITARQLPTDLGVCTLAMLVARMTILMGAHDTAVWRQNRHGHTQKC